MAFYHVLLTFHPSPKKVRCLFTDLTEKELKRKFLLPYRRGQNIFSSEEIVDVMKIRSVKIIQTERNSELELKDIQDRSWQKIQEFNRQSNSVVLISPGRGHKPEDIVEAGTNVTEKYISSPPGHDDKTSLINLIINNWIATIITGLIVAGITAWLGWG